MRAPSLARSSALNFADGAATLAGALVVSVLLARKLGTDGFGLYALTMSIVTFALLLARLGISSTVRRYVAELHGNQQLVFAAAILGRALRLGLATGLAATALLGLIVIPLAAFFHRDELRADLAIGAALLIPMVVVGILRAVMTGLQRYGELLRLSLVTSPLWVVGCAGALLLGAGVPGVLFVTLGLEVINLAALARWSVRYVGIRWLTNLPVELAARVRRYNVALAVLLILNAVVWERSEVLFLGRFQDATQVSFYAVPFAVTERVVDLLPGAILGVLLPGLSYLQGSADSGRFASAFSGAVRYLGMITLPICCFGIPLAPAVIRILYGQQFDGAIPVLQILLVAVIFGVLGQASRSAHLGLERQGFLLRTGCVAAVASIVLDLALIPHWGAVGAAVANTLVQAGWALTIFRPLWPTVAAETKRAVGKAAGIALALTIVLGLGTATGMATAVAIASGIVVFAAYALSLVRLGLVELRPGVLAA